MSNFLFVINHVNNFTKMSYILRSSVDMNNHALQAKVHCLYLLTCVQDVCHFNGHLTLCKMRQSKLLHNSFLHLCHITCQVSVTLIPVFSECLMHTSFSNESTPTYNTEHKTVKLWKKLAHARIHSTATHRHSGVYLQHASSLYTP